MQQALAALDWQRTLVCFVPALFDAALCNSESPTPALDRFARQADRFTSQPLDLAGLLGLLFHRTPFPLATLIQHSLSWPEQPAYAQWAVLEPVTFYADRDRLLVFPMENDERDALASRADTLLASCNAHFAEQGLGFFYRDGHWLLGLPKILQVNLPPLAVALRDGLDQAMPSGADAAYVKQLINAVQMLMHQEARAGEPYAVRGFWPSGLGQAEPLALQAAGLSFYGATPVMASLRLYFAQAETASATVLSAGLRMPDVNSSWNTEALEVLCAEALQSLNTGRVETLVLLDIFGQALLLRRWQRWRFWRRDSWQDCCLQQQKANPV